MSPYDASKGGLPDLMKSTKPPVIQDLQSIVRLSQELSAERARAGSLTASIVTACEGTGCANAHELAEALKAARQLIYDHCEDEGMVRVILKEFDRSDSYGSDGPIELAERAAEALKVARADRDRLQQACEYIRFGKRHEDNEHPLGEYASQAIRYHNAAKKALSRVNGGGE